MDNFSEDDVDIPTRQKKITVNDVYGWVNSVKKSVRCIIIRWDYIVHKEIFVYASTQIFSGTVSKLQAIAM
jgi:hypothetical protein